MIEAEDVKKKVPERALLMLALKDNMDAVMFVEAWFRLTQVWDDLVDRDQPVSPEVISGAFFNALALPRNSFYSQYFMELNAVIVASIMNWWTANEFEKSADADKIGVAYVLRDAPTMVLEYSAYLVGGVEWAKRMAPQIREWVHDASEESMAQYVQEHTAKHKPETDQGVEFTTTFDPTPHLREAT